MYLSMMKRTVLTLVTTFVLFAANVSPGHAQLLFDNNPEGSYSSGGLGAMANNPYNVSTMAGDVFKPTLSGTATSFNFGGYFFNDDLSHYVAPNSSMTFTLTLYATSGGVPTNPIATSTLSNVTWTSSETYGDYNVSGTIETPFTLDASLTYYLGLSGDTGSSDISFSFMSTETPGPADVAYVMNNGVLELAPTEVSPSLAFSIEGTAAVPEPSSYLMVLIGLGALAFEIGRRRVRVS